MLATTSWGMDGDLLAAAGVTTAGSSLLAAGRPLDRAQHRTALLGGFQMTRAVLRAATVATVAGLLTVTVTGSAFAAGEEISATLDRITGWIQGILLSVGILSFVLGAGFYLAEGTIGGQERGKALMVGAIIGVILGFLAKPIVNLAASFVR